MANKEMSKPCFGASYWVGELVRLGRTVEPEKYTPDYIDHMHQAWAKVSFTKLHLAVLHRRKELGDN